MRYAWLLIGVWVGYNLINIGIAEMNDATRRRRIKAGNTRQIEHPLWAFIYCLICAPMYLWFKDWWLITSLLLLHISTFPVAYNHFAGNPAFFLSRTTKAWTDKTMVRMGLKSTEEVNIIAMALSVVTLFLSILL